jgi:hypothetical protein
MREKTTPFEYLANCSQMSLEDFELARLDRVASLRKELRDIAEEWIEAAVEAQLAHWVRENRQRTAVRPAKFRECEDDEIQLRNSLSPAPRASKHRQKIPASLPAPIPIASRQHSYREPLGPGVARAPHRHRKQHRDAFVTIPCLHPEDECQ